MANENDKAEFVVEYEWEGKRERLAPTFDSVDSARVSMLQLQSEGLRAWVVGL